MATKNPQIRLEADCLALLVTLEEITVKASLLPESTREALQKLVDPLLAAPECLVECVATELVESAASGTFETTVRIQPSELLLTLLSAVTTGDLDVLRA